MSRFDRRTLAAAAATFALVFGATEVSAQAARGGGRSTGISGTNLGGDSGDGSRVVLYGTPGNCVGARCDRPAALEKQPIQTCGNWQRITAADGSRVKRCMDR